MKKLALATLAALGLTGTASAAVLTLENVTTNGASDFTFNYQATLGPDEGVRRGDQFVIFDFNGYIDGSVFSGSSNLVASVENVSSSALLTPGATDDASIANLVFTYTGPNFRTGAGPLGSFDFPAIGARSIFGATILDAFYTLTTKNNPTSERGRKLYTLGLLSVPSDAVPEPATWAMMLGGFGLLGAASRRRARGKVVTA